MLRRDEKGRRLESGCLQGPPGIRELQEWEVTTALGKLGLFSVGESQVFLPSHQAREAVLS